MDYPELYDIDPNDPNAPPNPRRMLSAAARPVATLATNTAPPPPQIQPRNLLSSGDATKEYQNLLRSPRSPAPQLRPDQGQGAFVDSSGNMQKPSRFSSAVGTGISAFLAGARGPKEGNDFRNRYFNTSFATAANQHESEDADRQAKVKELLPAMEAQMRSDDRAATLGETHSRDAATAEYQRGRLSDSENKTRLQYDEKFLKDGYELGPDGKPRPKDPETLDPLTRSKIARNSAEDEYRDALKALAKAKNDPNSPMFKQAQEKVDIAKKKAMESGLSEAAVKLYAERVLAGDDPSMGLGTTMRVPVANKAAELAGESGMTGADIATNKSIRKAESASLTDLQKTLDMVSPWIRMSKGNWKPALDQIKKIVDTGSPLLNQPLRNIDARALGADDQVVFNAAIKLASTDAARIITQAKAQGVLSDSARKEIDQIAGPNMDLTALTPSQLYHVVNDVFIPDMERREKELVDQITTRKKSLSGTGKQGDGGVATHRYNPQTGKIEPK